MRRLDLAVDECEPHAFHVSGQHNHGQLRCAGREREHAFTDEKTADGHAVESAHEFVPCIPHLDTGRIALLMEPGVGPDDVGAQPGTLLLIAPLCMSAALDHAVEGLVDGELVLLLADERPHGVRHMNLGGEDDKSPHGAAPQRLVVVAKREPGKDAVAVGQQQPLAVDGAAIGEKSVGLAQAWVGESHYVGVKTKNHASARISLLSLAVTVA